MPNEPMERINIEITANADSATKTLGTLNRALGRLKKLSESLGTLSGLKQVDEFASAVNRLADTQEGLSKTISTLRKLTKLDFTNLAGLGDAASNIERIASAMPALSVPKLPKLDKEKVSPELEGPKDLGTTFIPSRTTEAEEAIEEVGKEAEKTAEKVQKATGKLTTFQAVLAQIGFKESHVFKIPEVFHNIAFAAGNAAKRVGSFTASLVTTPIKKFSSAIEGGITRIGTFVNSLKRIMLYRVIRGLISGITKGIKEGINNLYQYSKALDGTFSKSMDTLATSSQYLKNSLGAMLSPLINAAAPLIDSFVDKIVDLINEINRLFALLSGASSWTKAIKQEKEYAKAAGDAADSANELKKTLLGFDEINRLNDTTNSKKKSDDTPDYSGMFEEVAFDGTSWAEKIRNALSNFSDIFDVFKAAWENQGKGVIDSFLGALGKVQGLLFAIGSSFREVFTNGTGQKTLELILLLCQDVFNTIGNFAEAFRNAWEKGETGTRILQAWWNIINDLLGFLHDLSSATAEWFDTLDLSPLLQGFAGISEAYEGLVREISGLTARFYKEVILPIVSWIVEELAPAFEETLASAIRAVTSIVKPFGDGFLELVKSLEPVAKFIGETVVVALNGLRDCFDEVTRIFDERSDEIEQAFSDAGHVISSTCEALKPVFEGLKGSFENTWKALKDGIGWLTSDGISIFTGFAKYLDGTFSGDIRKTLDGLVEMFSGHFDLIVSIQKLKFDTMQKATEGFILETLRSLGPFGNKLADWMEQTKKNFTDSWNSLKSVAGSLWNDVKEIIFGKIRELKDKLDEKFNGIASKVEETVQKIKGFFKFEWELPHIKLPHFSITGHLSLDPPSIPTITVDWYEKGGFPKEGQLFAAREAGPELVGSIGGRTAVANNDQIVEGIAGGVRDANEEVVNTLFVVAQQIIQTVREKNTSVTIDGRRITKEVTDGQNRMNRMYGASLQNA